MQPLYSVGTWDTELQAYTPQNGLTVPSFNITIHELRQAGRELRKMHYGFWRRKHDDDSDAAVLVERTDGMTEAEILEQWKR